MTILSDRLRTRGTGAARQRALLAKGVPVAGVVDWLARTTRGETERDENLS